MYTFGYLFTLKNPAPLYIDLNKTLDAFGSKRETQSGGIRFTILLFLSKKKKDPFLMHEKINKYILFVEYSQFLLRSRSVWIS